MEFIILLFAGGALYYWFKSNQKKKELEKSTQTLTRIRAAVLPHARTLAIKRNQMIYKDDYGNYVFGKWNKEAKYFIENVLPKDNFTYQFLKGGGDEYEKEDRFNTVIDIVFEVAHEESMRMIDEMTDDYVEVDELTGEEFENYCVSILNQYGWDAKITKSTGDQGIDIIGKINGITAVFQCKRYAQPVGNSAVQEAISGKSFARAQIAAVVSNSTFTKSARQLAQAANIYLLHHTELEEFAEMISPEDAALIE